MTKMTRRDVAVGVGALALSALTGTAGRAAPNDPIARGTGTTRDNTIVPAPAPARRLGLVDLPRAESSGYGVWTRGPGLAVRTRLDLMPPGYARSPTGRSLSCASSR